MLDNQEVGRKIDPGFAFETLEDAKDNQPEGFAIITENRNYFYCVRRDRVEHYLALGYELVS